MIETAFWVLGVIFWMWVIVWVGDKLLGGLIYLYAATRDWWRYGGYG